MRIFLEINGTKHEAIERGMGLNKGTLTRWLNDGYPDAMGVHHLPDWSREVGPEFEDWLQEQNDPENVTELIQQPPMILTALLAQCAGQEVSQLIHDFANDGAWDARERANSIPGLHKVRLVIDALISEAEGFGAGRMA